MNAGLVDNLNFAQKLIQQYAHRGSKSAQVFVWPNPRLVDTFNRGFNG